MKSIRETTELFYETCKTTAIQTRNHIFNMMRYAKKDKIIKENPLAEETINFPDTGEKFHRRIIEEIDIEKVIEYCLTHWYIDVFTQDGGFFQLNIYGENNVTKKSSGNNDKTKILHLETGKLYNSSRQAGRELNLSDANIRRSCKTNGRSAVKGNHFRYTI